MKKIIFTLTFIILGLISFNAKSNSVDEYYHTQMICLNNDSFVVIKSINENTTLSDTISLEQTIKLTKFVKYCYEHKLDLDSAFNEIDIIYSEQISTSNLVASYYKTPYLNSWINIFMCDDKKIYTTISIYNKYQYFDLINKLESTIN